jgi:hypothetical protein
VFVLVFADQQAAGSDVDREVGLDRVVAVVLRDEIVQQLELRHEVRGNRRFYERVRPWSLISAPRVLDAAAPADGAGRSLRVGAQPLTVSVKFRGGDAVGQPRPCLPASPHLPRVATDLEVFFASWKFHDQPRRRSTFSTPQEQQP